VPDDAMLSPFPVARFAFDTGRDGSRGFELVVRSLVEDCWYRSAEKVLTRTGGAPARSLR
jgi:hypothetical protein